MFFSNLHTVVGIFSFIGRPIKFSVSYSDDGTITPYVRYVLNGEDLFMAKLMRAYLMDLEAYHEIHLDLMEKYDVRIHNLTTY